MEERWRRGNEPPKRPLAIPAEISLNLLYPELVTDTVRVKKRVSSNGGIPLYEEHLPGLGYDLLFLFPQTNEVKFNVFGATEFFFL